VPRVMSGVSFAWETWICWHNPRFDTFGDLGMPSDAAP